MGGKAATNWGCTNESQTVGGNKSALLRSFIRVVNAFRQGLDTRYGERSNPSIAAVLQKQASLSKRLSQTSSIEYADNYPYEVSVPEFERLSSRSHTETAVYYPLSNPTMC
ncbi:hypothetical protein Ocin01_01406 [Orchesella cincta]|uniref:Uncharacterized protein n=1 Tax=Orchesella cincta TaxID=48709 RepID=A0A1D2NJ86_ORCCI|nr:hypothetical protein Ocin01_01406 [Orchesella cincta]